MAKTEATDSSSLEPAAWLDRYGDYLYRFAISRLRDAEAAEEVVQDAFVAGLRAKDQFSGRGSEKAWLTTILHRKIVDFVRRRMKTEAIANDTGDQLSEALFDEKGAWREDPRIFGPRPAEAMEKREFWEVFRKCLSGLPRRQADVFSLREMDGVAGKEICKDLGISSSNLWVLLYRARMRLAACMKRRWHSADRDD